MSPENLQTLVTNHLGNVTSNLVQTGNKHEISNLTALWQSKRGNNDGLCPTPH